MEINYNEKKEHLAAMLDAINDIINGEDESIVCQSHNIDLTNLKLFLQGTHSIFKPEVSVSSNDEVIVNSVPIIELINTPIENLNLSARPYNCLARWTEARNIAQLLTLSYKDLYRTRNLGQKGIEEISYKVHQLTGLNGWPKEAPLENIPIYILDSVETYKRYESSKKEPEAASTLNTRNHPPLNSTANVLVIPEEDIERFRLADISALNLSIRPYNSLKRSCIDTVYQLLFCNYTEILSIRNLGNSAAKEIIDKVHEVYGIPYWPNLIPVASEDFNSYKLSDFKLTPDHIKALTDIGLTTVGQLLSASQADIEALYIMLGEGFFTYLKKKLKYFGAHWEPIINSEYLIKTGDQIAIRMDKLFIESPDKEETQNTEGSKGLFRFFGKKKG